MLNPLFRSGLLPAFILILASCSTQKKLPSPSTEKALWNDPSLQSAHIGISVYDPAARKYLYQYQDDKYFTPASNTKLFSLYAGLRYLGDSLPAIRYAETDTAIFLLPTGDPTLLHPDFPKQPVIDFLKKTSKNKYVLDSLWKDEAWGAGWSWDDYNDDYMAERSALPVYGNLIRWIQEKPGVEKEENHFSASPSIFSQPEVDWKLRFSTDTAQHHFYVRRKLADNIFEVTQGQENQAHQDLPFVTRGVQSAIELLRDTIGPGIFEWDPASRPARAEKARAGLAWKLIRSRPVDSLFRPMMFRSDNFFAEQILMMVGAERLGIMNDEAIIDTLLKKDLRGLPQKPHWADGSGLSRFNLFTPQDFIFILDTLQAEFGLDRMKRILPGAGSGTLKNYFKQDSGYIYAKTGSLSNVLALSGYMITTKNRLLIFSILINNYVGPSGQVRRAVESFLHEMRVKE